MNKMERKFDLNTKKQVRLSEASYKSGDPYYGELPAEPDYKGPEKPARYYKELTQYFFDTVGEYPEYSIIGRSTIAITLRTPDGKETIDLRKFDACADAEEAIEMVGHYFDPELFESKKKPFDSINTNAGNVEHNITMFNKLNSSTNTPCNNPINGPFGDCVSTNEALNESTEKSLKYQFIDETYGYDELLDLISGFQDTQIFQNSPKARLVNFVLNHWDMWILDVDFNKWYSMKYERNDTNDSFNEAINKTNTVKESYNIQFYQVFRSPTRPNENGTMVAQAGTEDEAHMKGKKICGEGKYLIKAVCDDGKVRYLEAMNESARSPQVGDRVKMDMRSKVNYGATGICTGRIGELCWVTWDDGTKSKEIKGYLTVIEQRSINESSVNKETVELEYSNLEFTQYSLPRYEDDWDTWERIADWTYSVKKKDIVDFLYEDCVSDEDISSWYEMTIEESYQWIFDNFDNLFEKYYEEILDHWEKDAIHDAVDNYDPDDYIDWDSMPGGHDDF